MTNKDLSRLPSEVITLVGRENLDQLNPFGQRAVVASLLEMYLKEGLDWMRENKEQLIKNMLILNRM
jgi:hypothetical protein